MKFNDFILTSTIFLVSRFAAATASFEEDQAASSAARNLKPAEVSFVLQYAWFSVSILLRCTVCACANVSISPCCSLSLFVTFRSNQNRVRSSKRTNDENISSSMYNNRRGFILTKEREQQILVELREARAFQTQSESQSDLQPGVCLTRAAARCILRPITFQAFLISRRRIFGTRSLVIFPPVKNCIRSFLTTPVVTMHGVTLTVLATTVM